MALSLLKYLKAHDNVVWDWNGTLLNDLDVVMKAEAEHFPVYGIPVPTLEDRARLFCFPIRNYYDRLGFKYESKSFEDINREFMTIYERLLGEAPLFHEARDLLVQLKTEGKKQFILSAAPQDHLHGVLAKLEVDHIFEAVYGLPNTNADSKLERGRQLVADTRIEPARTIMVGDSVHDAEVGRALGFDVLLLADGHQPFETLAKNHHHVLRTRF